MSTTAVDSSASPEQKPVSPIRARKRGRSGRGSFAHNITLKTSCVRTQLVSLRFRALERYFGNELRALSSFNESRNTNPKR